jgi:hypothetical protein
MNRTQRLSLREEETGLRDMIEMLFKIP